jgi:hypothetical protein
VLGSPSMRLGTYAAGALLLNGCGDNAGSLAVMGIVALVTGWAISASLRSRDGDDGAEDVEGAESLLPRFQTPAWLEESQVLLRVFGAQKTNDATNETTIRGLPFPIGFVVDIDDLVVRFNDLRLDGVEHSASDLYELALDNLRAREPALKLPVEGLSILRDEKGHAAARALLIPALLNESDTLYVAAPSRELLLIMADKDTMQEAHATFGEAATEDAPIPTPILVTSKGFEPAKWR